MIWSQYKYYMDKGHVLIVFINCIYGLVCFYATAALLSVVLTGSDIL